MKKIYFVRHGESVENAEKRYVGASAPLTAHGEEQARYVAERFASIPFDIVLTSTMERAKETGKAIAERSNKQIEHLSIFSEFRRPSACEGKNTDDLEVQQINQSRWEHVADPSWHHSDEENFFDVKERAQKALDLLVERPEENIVVASHGMFLKVCTCLVIAGDAFSPEMFVHMRFSMKTRNTGITICEYKDEKWQLHAWNDHAHLGDPKI